MKLSERKLDPCTSSRFLFQALKNSDPTGDFGHPFGCWLCKRGWGGPACQSMQKHHLMAKRCNSGIANIFKKDEERLKKNESDNIQTKMCQYRHIVWANERTSWLRAHCSAAILVSCSQSSKFHRPVISSEGLGRVIRWDAERFAIKCSFH